MALKIRLRQQGRKNQLVYRLVLTDSRSPRDGKYIETLGWYNPYESEPERNLNVKSERLEHWLKHGAVLTEKAEKLAFRGAPDVIRTYRKRKVEVKAKATKKKRNSRKKKELATA